MSGSSEGAKKARDKILESNPDFYRQIGSKSWNNPKRSRKTGFALMTETKRKQFGAEGGRKTKKEYKTKDMETDAAGGVIVPELSQEISKTSLSIPLSSKKQSKN